MITYTEPHNSQSTTDGFSQSLRETEQYFSDQGLSIFGSDHADLLVESTMFSDYCDHLVDGLAGAQADHVRSLSENARDVMLSESISTNITPVSSLTLPIIRKTWPRLALANAIPTEVAVKPKFTVASMKPFIIDVNGDKRYLPESLHEDSSDILDRLAIDNAPQTLPATNVDVLSAVGAAAANGDSIDVDVSLSTVTLEVYDAAGGAAETVILSGVELPATMDTRTNVFHAVLTATHSDGTVGTDTIFLTFDRAAGLFSGSSINTGGTPVAGYAEVVDFVVLGYVSTEMNNRVEEVGFDITDEEIVIPTAVHLAAPLAHEALTDLLNMFNIDGVSKVVDIMSSATAQKVDKEGLAYLNATTKPGKWERIFDVHPTAQYTGSPTEWKQEIRGVIDNLCSEMRDQTYFDSGHFVIVGNPIDVNLIPSIDWTFDSNIEEVGGVRVDYSLGTAKGAQRYKIVSSQSVTRGKLKVFFVPDGNNDQMTYKFYPYSLMISNSAQTGYTNPNNPNVNSIIASRRYTYKSYADVIGSVTILNNNGTFI